LFIHKQFLRLPTARRTTESYGARQETLLLSEAQSIEFGEYGDIGHALKGCNSAQVAIVMMVW
jgi:hypothetical protein